MIHLEGITKSFGSLQVLKGIDLEITQGEVVSIVGPSGAGKTTLLQIMGTLDSPDTGMINIDGTNVSRMKEKELSAFRNKHIGFVFQFHQLLPEFTALENVMIPAFIAGVPTKEASMRAMEILDFMGLKERASHKPNELSGGEKQRLAIARAIAKQPQVFIFDDSFSALDLKTDAALRRALAKKVADKTVIIGAQRISTILHADQILVLDKGQIVQQGRHSELLKQTGIYRKFILEREEAVGWKI